ncbi:putative manganese-dependent inorganic diphosphatase [uncultured Treponema sp.]|uniref:putative manganese-dependent inorganic diphosphatase n=1 Tax=uncultured Treponema sp. TaxID=162155 RepID=UPI0025DDE12A|nr:putative manganese-dependent inorganic diphosphatase [uncultured Treponema sp.]
MEKTIYIFGHKNPDTDSVVSATAYAAFRHAQGASEYKACRAGKLNPQTEYIYKKFGITPPEFIPDMNPRVAYYMNDKADVINQMTPFWEASAFMREKGRKVFPVVDDEGHYKAILNYNSFTNKIFEILKPEHHLSVVTNVNLMSQTLRGKVLCKGDEADVLHTYTIISGASKFESFRQTLDGHSDKESIVVVTGDREDIQTLCLERKVRALILSAGRVPSEAVLEAAKKSGTSIIVSKYDTASTSMLLLYSTPVRVLCDQTIKPIKREDTIQQIMPRLKEVASQILPVVDDENKVIGVLSEIDVHHEPKVALALVDHNEKSQIVDGFEHYKIFDIVDHHRLGSVSTKTPITFINFPLGSTSTIIARLFREECIEIPLDVAKLLLCGILSDTLILQSATTTSLDVETAEFLAKMTGLDVKALGEEIIKAGSRISGRSPLEVINQDMKEYNEGKVTFTVSQIEVDGTEEVVDRKDEFLADLENERKKHGAMFAALLVTDISSLSSIMLIAGDERFLQFLNFPKQDEKIYFLKDVVSRKKQLIPMLTEILASFSV